MSGGMLSARNPLSRYLRHSDVIVAIAVVTIVVMMVIPLPPPFLDVLIAFNMSFALVVLLVTMYTAEPLEFSIFPSLLLLTTLFRLALNVSSTRLILLNGYAGEVIRAFGQFVVGGNPVVGFIVFCILVIIQFVVITRGAERVAEVAARFTLDAMPGKQMSIDADLNAGLITEKEARGRRAVIEREADFYGAMDGASKFVKGDAIAAIIITVINLGGGFVVGVIQRGMSPVKALQSYSLLTVGDGLVSQIPALLISTATGIVVTRAASDSNLGEDLTSQILSQPRVLGISAGVLLGFALVPGLPHLPFLVLAGLLGAMAYGLGSVSRTPVGDISGEAEPEGPRKPEDITGLLKVDPLEIELGYGLLPLADAAQGGDLLDRVIMVRRQFAVELGFIVPPVRVRDNIQLKHNGYCIKVRGVEVAWGEIQMGHYLAMNPGTVDHEVPGAPTREPAFGLPALWISEEVRREAEAAGYTVVDAASVMATHLTEVVRAHAHELLGRQEVKSLIDSVKADNPAVVEELVPELLSLGEIQKVLQRLLKEGISTRDMVTVLETLADYARVTRDVEVLTEYVRQALSRSITRQFALDKPPARVIMLDPELEGTILDSVERGETGTYLALEPALARRMVADTAALAERLAAEGQRPIVVCSAAVRPYFRRIIERALPRVIVLSFSELEPDVELQSAGVVSLPK